MLKQLILADFYERTRRYSFLLTLGFVLFYGYLVITGKYTLILGECRGVYNAAWTGSLMAIGSSTLLLLCGFYLVKNTISRDSHTGVGEILTATSLGKIRYMMAKFLSNLMVLSTLIAILIPAALFMQFFLGETKGFSLWAFLSPFLFISLPICAFLSALAVLFEAIKPLRSTFGNIVYFFVFQLLVVISIESHNPAMDFIGASSIVPHMQAAAQTAYPNAKIGLTMGFVNALERSPQNVLFFEWLGYPWPTSAIISKILFIGISLLLVLLAASLFKGFEPDEGQKKPMKKKPSSPACSELQTQRLQPKSIALEPVRWQFSLPALVRAELRVMFTGINRTWYLIALVFVVLALILPLPIALGYVLPAAWIWPLTIWSGMGTREHLYRTHNLMACLPHPLSRQLPAAWLAGVILTLAMGSGMILKSLFIGDVLLFLVLIIASLFIPSLALALGKLSGSKKLFEIVYMLLWYIGPVNQLPLLNFMASDISVVHSLIPIAYLVLTILLICSLPLAARLHQAE